MLVPVFAAHNQNTFCTKFKASPFRSTLLTMSCHLPSSCLESSPTTLVPHMFFCVIMFALPLPHLKHRYLFGATQHSVRRFFACPFSQHIPTFLWLWSQLFTVFPFLDQTVEANCMLQCCLNFLPCLLNRDSSHLSHISSVQHRSFFRWPICFLVAFSDELFRKATFAALPSCCGAL